VLGLVLDIHWSCAAAVEALNWFARNRSSFDATIRQVLSTGKSESVVQESFDDAVDTETGVNVDGPDLIYQTSPFCRSDQLALDSAGLAVLARWLHFDME